MTRSGISSGRSLKLNPPDDITSNDVHALMRILLDELAKQASEKQIMINSLKERGIL